MLQHYVYNDITGTKPVKYNSRDIIPEPPPREVKPRRQKNQPYVVYHRRSPKDKVYFTTIDDALEFCEQGNGFVLRGHGIQIWPTPNGSPGRTMNRRRY